MFRNWDSADPESLKLLLCQLIKAYLDREQTLVMNHSLSLIAFEFKEACSLASRGLTIAVTTLKPSLFTPINHTKVTPLVMFYVRYDILHDGLPPCKLKTVLHQFPYILLVKFNQIVLDGTGIYFSKYAVTYL